MRTDFHGFGWFAGLIAGCVVLIAPLLQPQEVRLAAVSPSTVVSAVAGDACAPAAFAAAGQQGSACSACWQCVNREGESDRCLDLCGRLGCDPEGGHPRCDVIAICIEGFRWDPIACMCLPDK